MSSPDANPLSDNVRGLIASEDAFRELLESAPDGIIITDAEGCMVLVNRQAEHMFGYQRDDLLGHKVEMLIPERHRQVHERHRASYQQAPRTRPMGIGLQLSGRRPDGNEFPVEISLSPIRLEGRQFAISTIRDVSDRKRLEREKDELLASLKHILDGVSDAIVALDANGTVVRVNPAGCALLGANEAELLGRPAREVFGWENEAGRLLDVDEYAYRETMRTGGLVTATDRYLRRVDGNRIPVTVSSAMVTDVAPDNQLVVQVVRDISREREVEELKNRIISLVSHELRTPIGHIKGFSSSLLDSEVQWDAETQRDFISEIDREADRLSALVRDLLDMSKIESGAAVNEKVATSPAALTREALRDLGGLTGDHVVVNDVDDRLPDVLADGPRLERVIGNLVENAVKYTPAGTEIRIAARPVDGLLEWSVTDRGPGVPPAYRERVFDRFVRAPGTGPRTPGTGLGLPICKGIVEAHGGKLWLESPPKGGARFLFRIPLAASDQPRTAGGPRTTA